MEPNWVQQGQFIIQFIFYTGMGIAAYKSYHMAKATLAIRHKEDLARIRREIKDYILIEIGKSGLVKPQEFSMAIADLQMYGYENKVVDQVLEIACRQKYKKIPADKLYEFLELVRVNRKDLAAMHTALDELGFQ